ncbi:MAG TPA: SOS response-associated peptidase [Kiritimatiellia bacterium]|nr:SOS response-associated peptidase [Kiritimatiellia bacterium]HMO97751.1 SOS response-associated peptidase [Kiritimatiellia bacterium]HMP95390.1 SOS response-associated peptidase [Kiritimatiellia bacterium]
MCGRLTLTANYKEKIRALFDDVTSEAWLPPRYNITPGQRLPVLTTPGKRHMDWQLWGWNASMPGRAPLINARGETVHRLPTFRDAFRERRCLIFADGFYEWHRVAKQRPQPYYFKRADGAAFPLAGMWRADAVPSCVIITTEANGLMHPVHHRMPVIFTPESAMRWLDPDTHPDTLVNMLQPFPSEAMTCHPVSDRVNRAGEEGETLVEPVRILEQPGLF